MTTPTTTQPYHCYFCERDYEPADQWHVHTHPGCCPRCLEEIQSGQPQSTRFSASERLSLLAAVAVAIAFATWAFGLWG